MILDDIVAHKRLELDEARRSTSLAAMRQAAAAASRPKDFAAAIRRPGLSLIAEVKRRSPAKGIINAGVDPVAQARVYAGAGARCISVLTDQQYFGGSNADLQAIGQAVDVPLLRKDFTIDEYQVWEARAIGASAVLLIVRALDRSQLVDYQQLAGELGLAALVEVHGAPELDRALQAGARLLGINNRDLTTMTVDLNTTIRLHPQVPPGVPVIGESGIRTPDDVRRLAGAGLDGILVGEALMASGDPAATLASFLAAAGSLTPAEEARA